jgi:hypothetical protein
MFLVTGPRVGRDDLRARVAEMGVGNPRDGRKMGFRVQGLGGADTLRTAL